MGAGGQRQIGADAGKRTKQRRLQAIPSRMRRIAIERRPVRLLQGDHAPGAGETHASAQQSLGIAGRAGDKAHVDEIERRGRQIRGERIAAMEFDIGGRVSARMGEMLFIHIEADQRVRRGQPDRSSA